ncbi:MAG: T9SS type A sorting domain-containing protein [Taibaiella sp.]|nr:T9SS type A sorting domain-containing protein [Taibaiella sp.]
MRQILPLLFMGFAATGTQAQTNLFSKNTPSSTAKAIAQSTRAGAKTTAAYWRLAATSDYSFNGSSLELTDSAFYKYSNGRGSVLNTDDIDVDDYGLSSTILYDTAVMLTDNGGGLEPYRRFISNYDGSNRRMEFLEQYDNGGGLKDNSKHLAVRDANGNITKETTLYWNGMGNKWDTSDITYRVFDSQNKLLTDSTVNYGMGVPNPGQKSVYTYDGSGNMVYSLSYSWNGSSWDSSAQVFNTYSNNKIVTSLEQYYDTAGWVNDYADSTGYDNNGYYNYHLPKYWDVDSAKWIYDQLETRTNNSKGLPTNVFFSQWNDTTSMWEIQGEGEVSYDSNDNPTSIEVYVYFGGFKLPTPFLIRNMYWEYYFNVGVQDAQKKEQVVIYPNPASTNINIVLGERKDANIMLTGMNGQTVRNMQATGVQKTTLNVSGLPAGNYILSVESEGHAPARQLVTIQ